MQSLHTPSDLMVMFDDEHAVANAGLALAGLLSEKLGLEDKSETESFDIPFVFMPKAPPTSSVMTRNLSFGTPMMEAAWTRIASALCEQQCSV